MISISRIIDFNVVKDELTAIMVATMVRCYSEIRGQPHFAEKIKKE
jgi:hypothetical protein